MNIDVLTLFPAIPRVYFSTSIMARAVSDGIIHYNIVNIRDFAHDKHKHCDAPPYGGGPGMLMRSEPLGKALDSVDAPKKRVVYVTPSGKLFEQGYARSLAQERALVLICGRYEGIDQRIIDEYVDDEVCIGNYVLSSGEIAALVLIDAVSRCVSGVIRHESLEEESFVNSLVEYPQYTRPRCFHNRDVPPVLLSGHHAHIRTWRLARQIEKTRRNRPDLLSAARASAAWTDRKSVV